MQCRGIRGATTVSVNNREQILAATRELLTEIVEANSLQVDDIACVFFTTTRDLNAEFPAAAAREMGWTTIPLMCAHEMDVPGALAKCLRVLVMCNTDRKPAELVHIYTRGARDIRSRGAVVRSDESR